MRTVRKEKAKKQAAPRGNPGVPGFPVVARGAKAFDVVGLGENSLDMLVELPTFPEPDSKQSISRVRQMAGGQVATAMVAVARLGLRARYLGGVGDDEAGRVVTRGLRKEGVRADLAVRRGVPTRGAVILVDRSTGARTVLEQRDPRVALRTADLRAAALTSGRVLLVDARDPKLSFGAARLARRSGVPVVLDVEHVRPGVRPLLRAVDVIVCSASFPEAVTGERGLEAALKALARLNPTAVVIATLGAAGSVALLGGRLIRTPALPVRAVDTTGAGDAFRGGLLAAWLSAGPGTSASEILRFANAVAALNCLGVGAQSGLPTRRQVTAFVTRSGHVQSK